MNRTYRFAFCMTTCLLIGLIAIQQARGEKSDCPPGADGFTEYRLFFGRNGNDGEVVSESDWQGFLAEEVTTRFPDGLTVLDAAGQWRNGSGMVVRERTKLVIILALPDRQGALQRTDEIIGSYKRAFNQESVLRTVTQTCASF